jgi:hypothetical protein
MAPNATIIKKLQTMWKWSLTNMRFFPSIYRPGRTEKLCKTSARILLPAKI